MNILMIGVQGSGKGTQAKRLAAHLGLCHVSTGDLLRSVTGTLKSEVEEVMHAGHLVDDNLMLRILKKRIQKKDCAKGIILDGFPRNARQARLLERVLAIDCVFELVITRREARRRLSGRVHCPTCGHSYNLHSAPRPKRARVCDVDGTTLVRRRDDTPRAITQRIATYYEHTEPVLVSYYKNKVIKIDGARSVAVVTRDMLRHIHP